MSKNKKQYYLVPISDMVAVISNGQLSTELKKQLIDLDTRTEELDKRKNRLFMIENINYF